MKTACEIQDEQFYLFRKYIRILAVERNAPLLWGVWELIKYATKPDSNHLRNPKD